MKCTFISFLFYIKCDIRKSIPFVWMDGSIFVTINKTWERTEMSFQFSEGRCVPTAVCDTLEFPRLPHRPTGVLVLEEQMDRSDAFTQKYLLWVRQLDHIQRVHKLQCELNWGITPAENAECVKFTLRLMLRKVY